MVDVNAQLDAVTRGVQTRSRRASPRACSCSRRCTRPRSTMCGMPSRPPERIPRWFLPVSGDLRLGGRYQLEGNAGGEVLEVLATARPGRPATE